MLCRLWSVTHGRRQGATRTRVVLVCRGGGQPVAENEPALKEEWLQALALYGQGKTTDEIAEGCLLSHRGAEHRLRRAREALGCATPREAVVEAARRGLL